MEVNTTKYTTMVAQELSLARKELSGFVDPVDVANNNYATPYP
jgi:hypothetical protein